MQTPRFNCLFVAAFMAIAPGSPESLLDLAKRQITVSDKISTLRRLLESFPVDDTAKTARDHLVALLLGSNRFEEALQVYSQTHLRPGAGDAVDFKLLDYWLKTGHHADLLRATAVASGPVPDFYRDLKLTEIRVQALLACGQYKAAHLEASRWLARYSADGIEGSRFEMDVRNIQFLDRHLLTLQRLQGESGKALFTASVPDSLQHWSQRKEVPIYFYKLIPARQLGQLPRPLRAGYQADNTFFQSEVDALNRGFEFLSGSTFSLSYKGMHTLYVRDGDIDPTIAGGNVLTSRVYAHTIPELYRLAGEAFVVLVDYRADANDEAAYMGDGIIHISAAKIETMVLMHEILHGLGATHRDWSYLQTLGYQFDPEDRGLMTFERGELKNLGMEEKNRSLLGWPQVGVVRFGSVTIAEAVPQEPTITASLLTNLPLN